MTMPGGLPPSSSVYEAPAIDPAEMTEAQQEKFAVAQIAAISAAAGASKIAITDNAVLMLVPLLRSVNPYAPVEIAQFALKAAEIVEAARQAAAQVTWSAVASRLSVHGLSFPQQMDRLTPSRTTPLETAYERPLASYRIRMAAGVKSIQGLIAQTEEERFQQLGGTEAAQARTGESNAEVEGKKRASSTSSGSDGAGSSGSGGASGGRGTAAASSGRVGSERGKPVPADRRPDADPDDFDATGQPAGSESDDEARERELDAAFDAEQELRNQAALAEEEKQILLEQQARSDMEQRMERMVNDDVAMAARDAHLAAMARTPKQVTGYRRVVHPELTRTGRSCGLCIAASTRIYSKKELMPIHNLCKCEPVEVVLGLDAGDQINEEDLQALYAEAGGTTSGEALKQQQYVVFDHPELGPILRNAKHSQQAITFSQREATPEHKARVKAQEDKFYRAKAESFGTTGRANA